MPDFRHNRLAGLAVLVVTVSVALSGLLLVKSKHEARQLFVRLEHLNDARDRLLVDWGRLKLEQSTWATHGRVESLARDQLEMVSPASQDILLVREQD